MPKMVTLGSQLDRVRSGIGAILLMEGGAGMGKSQPLERPRGSLGACRTWVGSGIAEAGEGVIERAPLMDAPFGLRRSRSSSA